MLERTLKVVMLLEPYPPPLHYMGEITYAICVLSRGYTLLWNLKLTTVRHHSDDA